MGVSSNFRMTTIKNNFLLLSFLLVGILLLISQCKTPDDLSKISSTAPYSEYNEDSALDTNGLKSASSIKSNIDIKEPIVGRYQFIVGPNRTGHRLILNSDSTFKENMWTDVAGKKKYVTGKWFFRNSFLVLRDKHKKEFEFICYKYNWALFLIPVSKEKYFSVQLKKTKSTIDSLTTTLNDPKTQFYLDKSLINFSYLCFYRSVEQ
jgi:hypothetical protein